ncbi:MAG: hypothetical protein ACE5GA_04210 [Candidatus Zixiibacteriota bacterium]
MKATVVPATVRRSWSPAFGSALIFVALALGVSGCVYYNTFYNAKKNFNEAEKERISSTGTGSGRPRINRNKYNIAIEKASVVLQKHPDSKYYDDALYVIGVPYFWTQEYLKSQRKFRELLVNFESSDFGTMSRLYLAKCKLELDERPAAVTIFQNLLGTVADRDIKVEATFAIADFYFEQTEYDTAQVYYQRLVDSLASDEADQRRALLRIADGHFARFEIAAAKERYLESLEMNPTIAEEFLALFHAGKCSYLLQDVEGGMESFKDLTEDERFYDSIGVIRMEIARGYEMDDDLILAEEEYKAISVESRGSLSGGAALYNLGLIYQFDYEDLDKALEYYDEAKTRGRSLNPYYDESVKRAADISKLAAYETRFATDSTTTLEQLDEASRAQIRLGELYLFDLNLPDSALTAFRYAVDSFPSAYDTPRAMISLAVTHRDFYDDTLTYDSLIQRVLDEYPRSDYSPEALEARGLLGTPADTGYPASYFAVAESWLVDRENVDSALFYYQFIVDSFPRSSLAPKARFSAIWLEDELRNPGDDSSIVLAYTDLAELYPEHEYGQLAGGIVSYRPQAAPEQPEQLDMEGDTLTDTLDSDSIIVAATDPFATSMAFDTSLTPELRYYINSNGRVLKDAPSNPSQYRVIDFIYPSTAGGMPDFYDFYYQVKIDFDGRVLEYELKNPTQYTELNGVVNEQINNLIFDVGKFDAEGIGDGWFVYKRRVTKPDYLR